MWLCFAGATDEIAEAAQRLKSWSEFQGHNTQFLDPDRIPVTQYLILHGEFRGHTPNSGAIAGGGKFENGAETAAFAYLFNEVFHVSASLHGLSPLLHLFCPSCASEGTIGYAVSFPGPFDWHAKWGQKFYTEEPVGEGYDASSEAKDYLYGFQLSGGMSPGNMTEFFGSFRVQGVQAGGVSGRLYWPTPYNPDVNAGPADFSLGLGGGIGISSSVVRRVPLK
jgi:hypothetical protein